MLAVGRLVTDKNLAGLISAFAGAGLAGEAELEICGTGPLEGELRALAADVGVPVRFTGYVPPADLPGVYAGADVLALVSTYEPFGVAAREAAAAGLPLICSADRRRRGRRRGRGRERDPRGPAATAARSAPRWRGWCATATCAASWPRAAAR